MVSVDELKSKTKLTRSDIAELLSSIGKPGEKREEKLEAIKQLNRANLQKYGLETTLDSYLEY